MSKRYFSPLTIIGPFPCSLRVEDQEAHHLIHVMRAQVNTELILFDGSGAEFEARIQKLEKRSVFVEILARREVNREPAIRLEVGVALPKGDRQQWLAEKLVELGCAELTPIYTRRGVAEPGEAAIARLRRFVVEASKQCGRNRLMQINSAISLAGFLADDSINQVKLFLDASGSRFECANESPMPCRWKVAIGPEGGWSEEELALAVEKNWQIASLGSRVLRVETAAAAICARICTD